MVYLGRHGDLRHTSVGGSPKRLAPVTSGQFVTVMLTPGLKALPVELKASERSVYEPLGTVVVFQLKSHP